MSGAVQAVNGSARVMTATLRGAEAVPVTVEVRTSGGLPGLEIVGMPDSAVLEARPRVRCAIKEAGFDLPRVHVTVNLAPGELRKSGTGFDLPIALAILIATGQLPPSFAERALFVGELSLQGEVCPVRGDVAYALLAEREGLLLVTSSESPLPYGWRECALGMRGLGQARGGVEALSPLGHAVGGACASAAPGLDYEDVVDQELAKRAMVVAAAGGHGALMVGPPGGGKTMLARRLPSILPPLDEREAAEAMLVHSVAGAPIDALAAGVRPFRAPHHSISRAGLVGGGRPVTPGEVSLAHHGVLYLDELPEFSKGALQALRQPLESGEIVIVRADGTYTFPCRFQLVAAANPCPCGYLGDRGHECTCTPTQVSEYQGRVGGPIMDRIDIVVDVPRPKSARVIKGETGESSASMAQMVAAAREFARWRASRRHATADPIADSDFDVRALAAFEGMADRLMLGGRAIVRVARVARTIADLAEHEKVVEEDLVEALGYRSRGMG